MSALEHWSSECILVAIIAEIFKGGIKTHCKLTWMIEFYLALISSINVEIINQKILLLNDEKKLHELSAFVDFLQ